MPADTFIVTIEERGETVRCDPVWAAPFGEPYLFRGARRVVLTSATLTRKTADLLGIMDKDFELVTGGDGFPVARRPVYLCPALTRITDERIRMDHRMTEWDWTCWLAHIDRFIGDRADRKGIVHTVSYARRDRILAESAHRHRMMTHEKADTARQIERFKAAPAGTILISPAVTTGYDFPYTDAEYQVLCKIPFPDSRDPITRARTLVDKEYPTHLAMQELVQTVGRIMRAPDDRGETLIADAHTDWFLSKRHRHLAPDWFWAAVRRRDDLPAPPPRVAA
jgi:Rad3-related DNA helicase